MFITKPLIKAEMFSFVSTTSWLHSEGFEQIGTAVQNRMIILKKFKFAITPKM